MHSRPVPPRARLRRPLGAALAAAILALTVGALARGAAPPVVLVVAGNTNGVLEPCGCATGQGGGLARRATAVARLRAGGDAPLLVDTGNLVSRLAPDAEILDQARLLLHGLGFAAGALGPAELELGAATLLKLPAERRLPLVATNVTGPNGESLGPQSVVIGDGTAAVEVFAVIAPARAPGGFRVAPPAEALREPVARAGAAGRRVLVIAHVPPEEARALPTAVPGITLLLGDPSPQDGPAGGAHLAAAPPHGRLLLRLSLAGGSSPEVGRREVPLPQTLPGDASVEALVRAFYDRRRTTLNVPRPSPGGPQRPDLARQAAEQCGTCHAPQQRQWAASKHAIAWHTLREKQADTRKDCIRCHTTSPAGTPSEKALGVGCAACHGDGAAHSRSPNTPGLIVRRPARNACEGCHTEEASPQFDHPKYLPAVRH